MRYAAVLVLFVASEYGEALLFTKRSAHVETHRGQISFPGGMNVAEDITKVETALRECCEEIGVCDKDIEIIDALSPITSKDRDFLIYPFTGRMKLNRKLRLNQEVERVLLIPVDWLSDPDNLSKETYDDNGGGKRFLYRFAPYSGETVWGITAAIVVQALSIKIAEVE